MSKSVVGLIKLKIVAGAASAAPPVGPALGQKKIPIMEFCKQFNEVTQDKKEKFPGMKIPVKIKVYSDRTFTFVTKLPSVSDLIKKELKLKKGSSESGKVIVDKISMEQVKSIADLKYNDMNAFDLNAAINMVIGTAHSIGIEVVD